MNPTPEQLSLKPGDEVDVKQDDGSIRRDTVVSKPYRMFAEVVQVHYGGMVLVSRCRKHGVKE